MMRWKTTIKLDGTRIIEVLDRGEHNCKEIHRVTDAAGQQLSEEITGPDCDTVLEVAGE
jgi:hypothetical protein